LHDFGLIEKIDMKHTSLKVWQMANELVVLIHEMSMSDIPLAERFEIGSQIRRSMFSVKANIVEGFSSRIYKQDFIRFLTIAKGSADETIDHLDTLFATHALKDAQKYHLLRNKLSVLSFKLFLFINSVKSKHQSR